MAKDQPLFSFILSALFATFLLCGLSLLAMNKFSIWGQLGAGEKFWTIFALVYAIVLTLSGWLYGALKIRAIGLLHATLMLSLAGLALYEIARGAVTNPGADNAAAGIIAAANLIFIVIGVLAASCGVALMCRLFPAKENPPAEQ
jgi:hypothetical protein